MATTPDERLRRDMCNGIRSLAINRLKSEQPDLAKKIVALEGELVERILNEIRIRWTIIERPRKQRTLRQVA